jgi:hypothetical protein
LFFLEYRERFDVIDFDILRKSLVTLEIDNQFGMIDVVGRVWISAYTTNPSDLAL